MDRKTWIIVCILIASLTILSSCRHTRRACDRMYDECVEMCDNLAPTPTFPEGDSGDTSGEIGEETTPLSGPCITNCKYKRNKCYDKVR